MRYSLHCMPSVCSGSVVCVRWLHAARPYHSAQPPHAPLAPPPPGHTRPLQTPTGGCRLLTPSHSPLQVAADCFSLARLDASAAHEPTRQELMAECALLLGRHATCMCVCTCTCMCMCMRTACTLHAHCMCSAPPHAHCICSAPRPSGRPHDAVALLKAALGEAAGQRAIGQTRGVTLRLSLLALAHHCSGQLERAASLLCAPGAIGVLAGEEACLFCLRRGHVLLAQRRYDEAMAAYRQALEHVPQDALALEAVAWASHLAPGEKHSDKAERKTYNELLRRVPADTPHVYTACASAPCMRTACTLHPAQCSCTPPAHRLHTACTPPEHRLSTACTPHARCMHAA